MAKIPENNPTIIKILKQIIIRCMKTILPQILIDMGTHQNGESKYYSENNLCNL